MPTISLGREPTLIIQTVVGVLNVLQLVLIGAPTWLHALIAAVIIAAGAVLNRSQVSPAAPSKPAPAPPAPPTAPSSAT